ncbi:hypothetical protein [Dactylosporangium sp. CA-092794]|uniref:hypothetical protein n=1 Tax=Dactylosporangium sp. CA-092794 TaxID=3239929 RepID=UPI003D93A19E
MADTRVEDAFARFADEYTGSFRPVPVEAMPGWRRARRKGALWLGGLVVALVAAVSVNALQPVGGDGPPGVRIEDRPVHLDGANGYMRVQFVDAEHGWVMIGGCPAAGSCEYTMGKTADGGRSWARVDLPELPARPVSVTFQARDAGSAVLEVSEGDDDAARSAWEIGGTGFHRIDGDPIGIAAWLSATPAPPAWPAVRGTVTGLASGRSGPLWAQVYDGLITRVAASRDGGRTWTVLPEEFPAQGVLRVSPDGRDAWLFTDQPTRLWRLREDGASEVPGFPTTVTAKEVNPVDGGGLLVRLPTSGLGVWREGQFEPLPEPMVHADLATVLPDGAIALVLLPGPELIVGGDRTGWVRYPKG